MSRKPEHRLFRYPAIILCLIVCSLLINGFGTDNELFFTLDLFQRLTEHGAIPDHLDLHEHDDDFVYSDKTTLNTTIFPVAKIRDAYLKNSSRSLSPFLPPPKSA